MPEKTVYYVQGSAPDPYIVEVNFSPFTISCTCQAAENQLPCKHRIMILQGNDPGIVKGDKLKLDEINSAAVNSGVFELLKDYDDAKAERKQMDYKAENAFGKYRTARLDLAQKKVKTDKAVQKTRADMEAAIDAIVPAVENTHSALKALHEIFKFNY